MIHFYKPEYTYYGHNGTPKDHTDTLLKPTSTDDLIQAHKQYDCVSVFHNGELLGVLIGHEGAVAIAQVLNGHIYLMMR